MNGMWSSARPKGWPRHGFEKRGGAIFFGIVAMFAAWFIQVQYEWDGMEKYYLAHYVVASTGLFQKYLVLHTVDRRGQVHPTVPAEVVQLAQQRENARGEKNWKRSDELRAQISALGWEVRDTKDGLKLTPRDAS